MTKNINFVVHARRSSTALGIWGEEMVERPLSAAMDGSWFSEHALATALAWPNPLRLFHVGLYQVQSVRHTTNWYSRLKATYSSCFSRNHRRDAWKRHPGIPEEISEGDEKRWWTCWSLQWMTFSQKFFMDFFTKFFKRNVENWFSFFIVKQACYSNVIGKITDIKIFHQNLFHKNKEVWKSL